LSASRPIAREDREEQAAILDLILAEHPTQLTLAELQLALGRSSDFADRDAVGQAVKELAAAGLLRRHLDSVLPTRAALRYRALASRWP
jgi:hypothetical protein